MSNFPTAEEILSASRPKRRLVRSKWGDVWVHSLAANDRVFVQAMFGQLAKLDAPPEVDVFSYAAARSLRDAAGELIFNRSQAAELAASADGDEIERLASIALGLSGIAGFAGFLADFDKENPDAQVEPDPEVVEFTPEGNSTPSESSPTSSPSN